MDTCYECGEPFVDDEETESGFCDACIRESIEPCECGRSDDYGPMVFSPLIATRCDWCYDEETPEAWLALVGAR